MPIYMAILRFVSLSFCNLPYLNPVRIQEIKDLLLRDFSFFRSKKVIDPAPFDFLLLDSRLFQEKAKLRDGHGSAHLLLDGAAKRGIERGGLMALPA